MSWAVYEKNKASSSESGPFPFAFDPIADLYDKWYKSPWNAAKYSSLLLLKQIPFVSANVNMYEGKIENQEYMNRHGLTWDDIMHPERLPGTSSLESGYRVGVNFVSDNIRRLYK